MKTEKITERGRRKGLEKGEEKSGEGIKPINQNQAIGKYFELNKSRTPS